jgi:outer membrane lipoprotein carrier protein
LHAVHPVKRCAHLLCLITVLLWPLLPSQAQQSVTAELLASRIDKHYNTLHSLEVHFTQQYQGMGMNRRESGTLLLKKPGRMRWTYQQPAGKLFVLDGKDGYFYSPGDSEAQRVPAKSLDDMRSPLRLLLGHTQLMKELIGVTLASNADGSYQLTGIPKGLEKRVSAFSLTATPDGIIHSLRIEETDGITNIFTFSDEKPNEPAPDTAFVFTPPAGVNVVSGMPPA